MCVECEDNYDLVLSLDSLYMDASTKKSPVTPAGDLNTKKDLPASTLNQSPIAEMPKSEKGKRFLIAKHWRKLQKLSGDNTVIE